ncbi:MAG: 4Fe-4S double cluster binding domain-containing protein [Spirochaetales bacterium]|nr:4Fe-4S double cluster binding domain-containing protein [Spirochaetales bacterium]
MSEELLKSFILNRASEEAFSRCRILSPLPQVPRNSHCDEAYPDSARSALLVFLPYDRSEGEGIIAPFARSNYYKEAVSRLKKLSTALRAKTKASKGDLRIFCNSRFPEKEMAWHCGLGNIGKNSLLLTPEYGSLGIIAGMFLPFDLPGDSPLEKEYYRGCGSCSLCRDACLAGAVKEEGSINKSLCFQHLSTERQVLSPEVTARWNILYGCQICQDVCPQNRKIIPGPALERGFLGARPDLRFILTCSDTELKEYRKGTVLGQAWIDSVALRRNALICLWREGSEEERQELVEAYRNSPEEILAGTAQILERVIPI